jgi:hypothetical protein
MKLKTHAKYKLNLCVCVLGIELALHVLIVLYAGLHSSLPTSLFLDLTVVKYSVKVVKSLHHFPWLLHCSQAGDRQLWTDTCPWPTLSSSLLDDNF